MKVLTAAQMRQAEQKCAASGTTMDVLMENAGRAVAETIKNEVKTSGINILILVGPGNNGGDGLVAGRYLRTYGFGVTIYCTEPRPSSDMNLIRARDHGLAVTDINQVSGNKLEEDLSLSDIVLDSLLGTGKSRPISGKLAEIMNNVTEVKKRRPKLKIISLDLPSGLDADTGAVDPACLFADETITLGFPKPGLFNLPGAERAGNIIVVDIGIPHHMADSEIEYVTESMVRENLPERPLISNKGSFGKVMVAAGSARYTGAAYLACSGAMRVGAGLVTLAIPASLHPILAVKLTETTYLPLPESKPGEIIPESGDIIFEESVNYQTMLIGSGLGQGKPAAKMVRELVFEKRNPAIDLVLDADALNIISNERINSQRWRSISGGVILTPHPGEMSRLAGVPVEKIQSDRIGTASRAACEWGKVVVLKGAYTVIAAPDGRVAVSPFANPGLASAGTGDVLAGMIAGFAAQHIPLFNAALAGVYIHGKAGEIVTRNLGNAGVIAGDLLPVIPQAIKTIKEN
jgi:ADP-dependent NAD(P)H-hydrate dehydratase / NAD(P)H-hydrate epimerase